VLDFVHSVAATHVIFRAGALASVGAEVERLGATRVLLVSGGPESAYADVVATDLGTRLAGRWSEVVMHVPVEVAQRAVATARDLDVDLVIALGGGSSTGMAKAIAKETGIRILAIPTTYAGSEMTSIWGLTEGSRKTTGRDLQVLPVSVIYDPLLTMSLPVDLSAASGMNALAHLVEGLYAPGISPVSALVAAEGVRALAAALPRVVADPSNVDARSEALYGSWLAGWTLGTTGMGIHHKICHTLGGTYDLPHAGAHSAVLSYATAYNEGAAPAAMDAICQAFEAAGRAADSAAGAVWDLVTEIGAPTNLIQVGYDPARIEETAEIVSSATIVNPREVTKTGVEQLLRAAVEGARP